MTINGRHAADDEREEERRMAEERMERERADQERAAARSETGGSVPVDNLE